MKLLSCISAICLILWLEKGCINPMSRQLISFNPAIHSKEELSKHFKVIQETLI